jgi:hypothetical protein
MQSTDHMMTKAKLCTIASLVLNLLVASHAYGDCISYVKGPIVFDVESCQSINVPSDLALDDEAYKSVRGLDAQTKSKLLNSYRGVLVKGLVVSSQAVQTGLGSTGALKGQEISIFIKPGQAVCSALDKKRLQGNVKEQCCNGDAAPPCMLRTAYFFESYKPLGSASSGDGEATRKKAETSPAYKEAVKLFESKKFRKSAAAFEKLKTAGSLDIKGYFLLASAYHKQEKCKKAVPHLEYIADQSEQGKTWADERPTVREANFLLARCYSRLGNAESAAIILNTYLIEPNKFRDEISRSMKLAEFGFIHTTKEYKEYKKQAEDFLRKTN